MLLFRLLYIFLSMFLTVDETAIPTSISKTGLGSSAALVSSIVGACLRHFEVQYLIILFLISSSLLDTVPISIRFYMNFHYMLVASFYFCLTNLLISLSLYPLREIFAVRWKWIWIQYTVYVSLHIVLLKEKLGVDLMLLLLFLDHIDIDVFLPRFLALLWMRWIKLLPCFPFIFLGMRGSQPG